MPITGSQKAYLYALSGVARSGATRSGYHSAHAFVSINGVQRAHGRATVAEKVLIGSLSTTESEGTPTTGSMDVMGFDVASGQEVIVTLGSTNNSERLFGGYVLATDQDFAAIPLHRKTSLSLIDYTWQLNRIKVIGRYSGAADAIVRELFADYAPDWSVTMVEAGLPTIDEITFAEPVDMTEALNRIASRVGAAWRGNYRRELYFGVTDPPDLTNPQPLTVSNPTFLLDRFGPVKRDRSQQVTRVYMEGGGSEAAADVAPGETILPLTLAPDTWYDDVGGVVVSGPQRISYTGRFEGGGGSLVGPGQAPLVAPTLALASGSGVTTGSHDVAVVYETAAGTSLPGPVATIAVGLIDAPTVAPVVGTPVFGVGPDPGDHQYAYTDVTAAGETTPTPLSAVVTTVAGLADPTVAATAPTAPASNGFGTLVVGHVYSYKYTWADAAGAETLPSPASATAVVGVAQRLLIGAPYCLDARCTRIYLYRSANGGGAPWTRIALLYPTGSTGAGGTAYIFNDNPGGAPFTVADAQTSLLSAAPTTNTAKSNAVPLTGISIPVSPLVSSKNIYGTAAGGSQLKLIASIAAAQTSYLVTTLDAALGANAPTVNTAAANQITTSAPLGPTGTTGRRFYMNPITGGARKLALTIANNTDITGTITASDSTLAAAGAEPSSDTSGLAQPAGQVLAGATSIPVAGLGGEFGFQTTGGWAIIGNGQHAARYSGITSNSLTGVPATGPGSIPATIAYNSQITAAPALTGVGSDFVSQASDTAPASRRLRLLTGTPTDRLGQLFGTGRAVTIAEARLKIKRALVGSGNIWVTIQSGSIAPSGTVLATSGMIDVATLSELEFQVVTFTFVTPPTLGAGTYYLVLHGDYARSDADAVTVRANITGAEAAYEYDGATVIPVVGVKTFWHQITAVPQPIVFNIHKGDPVNLWVTVDDTDAQATLSAILDPLNLLNGAAGIIEDVMQDRRLSIGEARARAQARLALLSTEAVSLHYGTWDQNTHPTTTVVANIAAPTSVFETLKVQSVTRTFIETSPPHLPICDVQASNERFTFAQLLAQGNN